MRLFYCICFLLSTFIASSQVILKGIVLDEDQNKPIANASVFLNTTSFGTVTNSHGNFELTVPGGRHDLIVSSVGYEVYHQSLVTDNISNFLTIKLKIKSQVMETIVVGAYDKDGWAKWGKLFTDNFIGTCENALYCVIKNPEVIHFQNSKKNNQLIITADEPLIIENKALGYTLKYQMVAFVYNVKSNFLVFTGYPFFQPMEGKDGKERRWDKRREEAYLGSMMHFMKTIYNNRMAEEGFEVKLSQQMPNLEKERVAAIYPVTKRFLQPTTEKMIILKPGNDSVKYYEKVLQQADSFTTVVPVLNADTISSKIDSTSTVKLYFKNYLDVVYKKKLAPYEYRRQFPRNGIAMKSQIILFNKKTVEILSNGNYFNPADLMSTGYWAWSEKIANLLPFDYSPQEGK